MGGDLPGRVRFGLHPRENHGPTPDRWMVTYPRGPQTPDATSAEEEVADAEAHDEQAPEAVQQVLLVADERARAVAVEDADGDDRREAVQGMERVELHPVPIDDQHPHD